MKIEIIPALATIALMMWGNAAHCEDAPPASQAVVCLERRASLGRVPSPEIIRAEQCSALLFFRRCHPSFDLLSEEVPPVAAGRALFVKNCAHCHGADAHGDEGPDLHKLDASDEWIAKRIRNGKAGEMTAFAGKLQTSEIDAIVAYLHSLK